MNFKLDENLSPALVPLFAAAGHEAQTMLDERLSGAADERVFEVIRGEQRILLSLDLDFSNPLRFPPQGTEGIVVLRPPRPTLAFVRALVEEMLPVLEADSLRGRLWIIEPGRIRVFETFDVRD